MRELKFKAWDKGSKRMIYSHEPEDQGKREYYPWMFAIGFSHWSKHQLEIMQFTGLAAIWEDDIVTIPDTFKEVILDDGTGPEYEQPHIARVIFKDGCFGVELGGGQIFYIKRFYSFKEILEEVALEEIKVIGNFHSNPRLME